MTTKEFVTRAAAGRLPKGTWVVVEHGGWYDDRSATVRAYAPDHEAESGSRVICSFEREAVSEVLLCVLEALGVPGEHN